MTASCVLSGVCSAGAPPAGHEPPAAAAGGAARRAAGEEGRRDPGLQRERSHAQQRYSHRTRTHWGPLWPETHPPSKSGGNLLSRFCVILLTNQQIDQQTSNQTPAETVKTIIYCLIYKMWQKCLFLFWFSFLFYLFTFPVCCAMIGFEYELFNLRWEEENSKERKQTHTNKYTHLFPWIYIQNEHFCNGCKEVEVI